MLSTPDPAGDTPAPYLIISHGTVFEVEFLPQGEEIYISRRNLAPEPSIFVRRHTPVRLPRASIGCGWKLLRA